jgi:predicted RecB family nuclease
LGFTPFSALSIIPRMVTWTWQSNACDVLGLGPRAAGRLATVGVRTVAELLTAKPQAAADKQFSVDTIAAWQREARLLVSIPELTSDAARILAAVEIVSAERLARSTPTELIAKIESLWRSQEESSWLAKKLKPTTAEICSWIELANRQARAQQQTMPQAA